MKKTEYIVEIYMPMSIETVWVTFSSATPFMNINAGDVVNPGLWPDSRSPQRVLRVILVEHALWEINNVTKHKLMVYTEEIEGIRDLKTPRTN